jgi:hypothetical protein
LNETVGPLILDERDERSEAPPAASLCFIRSHRTAPSGFDTSWTGQPSARLELIDSEAALVAPTVDDVLPSIVSRHAVVGIRTVATEVTTMART